ncbi:hypothetical protein BLNAU_4710 [Blattamonas nauphoetae]|uniref:Uncharacterized protein n=1 Tax=Blattamonas nauphoetae TaxID=2049346 RepID=A0ABQ9Y9P5_9EUKA|nr:hypothetical protein BLNAU_4710 [Blattamonas nauphoetae]
MSASSLTFPVINADTVHSFPTPKTPPTSITDEISGAPNPLDSFSQITPPANATDEDRLLWILSLSNEERYRAGCGFVLALLLELIDLRYQRQMANQGEHGQERTDKEEPSLISTLNPQSLYFAKTVEIHIYLLKIIWNTLCLSIRHNLARLAIDDDDGQQAVHEADVSHSSKLRAQSGTSYFSWSIPKTNGTEQVEEIRTRRINPKSFRLPTQLSSQPIARHQRPHSSAMHTTLSLPNLHSSDFRFVENSPSQSTALLPAFLGTAAESDFSKIILNQDSSLYNPVHIVFLIRSGSHSLLYFETFSFNIILLQMVRNGIRQWQKDGPTFQKRGQQIVDTLGEEGLTDVIELHLQIDGLDYIQFQYVLIGAQLIHILGGSASFRARREE